LEGTLKIIWFQLPCHAQGHFAVVCTTPAALCRSVPLI